VTLQTNNHSYRDCLVLLDHEPLVSLVTHLTIDRLPYLQHLAKTWDGIINLITIIH